MDSVEGKEFSITAAELEAADRYEVANYKRVRVTLKLGIRAWVDVKSDHAEPEAGAALGNS